MLGYNQSANDFLKRLDQIQDITKEHPIFLGDDPEDYPFDPSQVQPMRRCCFTNTPPPAIHSNSHKFKIRELAEKHNAQLASLPKKLHPFSYPFLSTLIPAIVRLVVQSTRPIVTIYFLYCILNALIVNDFDYAISHSFTPTSASLSLTIYIVLFSYWSYSLYYDEIFMRELGWTSKVKAGHYVNPKDPLFSSFFSESHKNPYFNGSIEYHNISSPLLFSGDWKTFVPFSLFAPDEIPYTRRWVYNHEDDEAIAFDISFPIRTKSHKGLNPYKAYAERLSTTRHQPEIFEHYHDSSKPVHIVLFGLNGGSNEPYILDYVEKVNQQGHTCVVFITRSLMGTIVINGGSFNAGKTLDLENCIRAIHIGCGNGVQDDLMTATTGTYSVATAFKHNVMSRSQSLANKWWKTPIAVTGWSLGGVITSLYCVTKGDQTGILCAVGLATSGDARMNIDYENSKRNWQGFLSFAAKVNILVPQQHLFCESGGSKSPISLDKLERIEHIFDFDAEFTCKYHGYDSVEHYYGELSFAIEDRMTNNETPLMILHGDDDPIISADTLLPAIEHIRSGRSKNLIISITRGGGHCGWPTGLNPWSTKWDYPVHLTRNFVNEVFDKLC